MALSAPAHSTVSSNSGTATWAPCGFSASASVSELFWSFHSPKLQATNGMPCSSAYAWNFGEWNDQNNSLTLAEVPTEKCGGVRHEIDLLSGASMAAALRFDREHLQGTAGAPSVGAYVLDAST